MRRRLVIIVLGIGFLIFMAWLGTSLTEVLPHQPTAAVQTAQAGPYQLTIRVDPNPPPITRPASLSIQVVSSASQQLVTNARVTVESTMTTMDMGTDQTSAIVQNNGLYLAHVQFSMSGPWQVRILVAQPGAHIESATFEIMTQ
ncbi:MAG TPA: FixH family protein [Ktedonobacteraceae bacterium]|jgi:hypothetical protein|nr:FixH family protein [Ktedonobacteraceae bacterium]